MNLGTALALGVDPVDLERLARRVERPAPLQPALELVCAALDRAALDRPALELQLTLP